MRSNLRAFGRSTVYHLGRPPQLQANRPGSGPQYSHISLQNIPSSPSCSRWFSCHHPQCHPASDFFSSARYSTSRSFDRRRQRSTSTENRKDETDESDDFMTSHRASGTHLPLPPSLPYSPDSIPFKRHLEILSFALSIDPDTSWSTYSALYPSLRRFVPNHLYRALVSQQLQNANDLTRWERVEELLRFAKQCGMRLEELGKENIERGLNLGLRYFLSLPQITLRDFHMKDMLVGELWTDLVRWNHRDYTRISPQTRQFWLELQLARVLQTGGTDKFTRRLRASRQAIDDLIEGGAIGAHGEIAIEIIQYPKILDRASHLADLQRLVKIMVAGVDVPLNRVFNGMGRFRGQCVKDGLDGDKLLKEALGNIRQALGTGPRIRHILERLQEAEARVLKMNNPKTPLERAIVSIDLEGGDVSTEKLHRNLTKMIKGLRTEPDLVNAMEVTVKLFEKLAHRRLWDPHDAAVGLFPLLIELRREMQFDLAPHVCRLADICLSANILPHLDANLIHILLYLLISSNAANRDNLILVAKVYNHARATDPPLNWTRYNYTLWRRFIRLALEPDQTGKRRQIHFASRLYADGLADGVQVHIAESLMLIRTIASMTSPSRYVLLERHLKDYQYFGYGSTRDFVSNLVEGLTSTARAKDAWLAFHLTMRIHGPVDLPRSVLWKIFRVLTRSGRLINYRRCGIILEYLPPNDQRFTYFGSRLIREVLQGDRQKDRPDRTKRPERRTRLAFAIQLYQMISKKGVQPTEEMIGHLVEGLVEFGYLEKAVKVAESLAAQGRVMPSSAMVALLVEVRVQDLDEETIKRVIRGYHAAVNGTRTEGGSNESDEVLELDVERVAQAAVELIKANGDAQQVRVISDRYDESVMGGAKDVYQTWKRVKDLQRDDEAKRPWLVFRKPEDAVAAAAEEETKSRDEDQQEVIAKKRLNTANDSAAKAAPAVTGEDLEHEEGEYEQVDFSWVGTARASDKA